MARSKSKATAPNEMLVIAIICSIIGIAVIALGISLGKVMMAVVGAFFLLVGLIFLYLYIQSVKGKFITYKTEDDKYRRANTYHTVSISKLTDEEYEEIKRSPNNVSVHTHHQIESRIINYPITYILMGLIMAIMSIIWIVVCISLKAYLTLLLGLPLYLLSVFLIAHGAMMHQSGENKDPNSLYNEYRNKIRRKLKPNSPEYNSDWYTICPHCHAINNKGDITCSKCNRKL